MAPVLQSMRTFSEHIPGFVKKFDTAMYKSDELAPCFSDGKSAGTCAPMHRACVKY